jgi:hypothetical protein
LTACSEPGYVPVHDRGPQDTVHSEMLRLLALSARQAAEIRQLRGQARDDWASALPHDR